MATASATNIPASRYAGDTTWVSPTGNSCYPPEALAGRHAALQATYGTNTLFLRPQRRRRQTARLRWRDGKRSGRVAFHRNYAPDRGGSPFLGWLRSPTAEAPADGDQQAVWRSFAPIADHPRRRTVEPRRPFEFLSLQAVYRTLNGLRFRTLPCHTACGPTLAGRSDVDGRCCL
jgi:hypothetical protein